MSSANEINDYPISPLAMIGLAIAGGVVLAFVTMVVYTVFYEGRSSGDERRSPSSVMSKTERLNLIGKVWRYRLFAMFVGLCFTVAMAYYVYGRTVNQYRVAEDGPLDIATGTFSLMDIVFFAAFVLFLASYMMDLYGEESKLVDELDKDEMNWFQRELRDTLEGQGRVLKAGKQELEKTRKLLRTKLNQEFIRIEKEASEYRNGERRENIMKKFGPMNKQLKTKLGELKKTIAGTQDIKSLEFVKDKIGVIAQMHRYAVKQAEAKMK